MKNLLRKRTQGFTIIEVMIVLAIAGLILAIIFLAVPALQRNSRNTQRNSDATHLGGVIETWQADNSGTTPTTIANANTPNPIPAANAKTVFIGGDTFTAQFAAIPAAGCATTCIYSSTQAAPYAVVTYASLGGAPATPALNDFRVLSSASCSGNTPATGTGMIVYYSLEVSGGNQPHCLTV